MSLDIWVVYDHPSDYPQGIVARRWSIDGAFSSATDTDALIIAPTLEQLRALIPQALTRIPRWPEDDPTILEVWL